MTMKKRFLGLALAAMVAVPATTAYANTETTTITVSENDTKRHEVTVQGVVNNKDGEAPQGMISVELPTKLAFTVDKDGNFSGSKYTVNNKGQVGIDISVASFMESKSGEGIEVLPESELVDPTAKYRNQVSLRLTGGENIVDLGELDQDSTVDGSTKLVSIKPSATSIINLEGKAGTKASSEELSSPDENKKAEAKKADDNGTEENFTLVFKINKTKG